MKPKDAEAERKARNQKKADRPRRGWKGPKSGGGRNTEVSFHGQKRIEHGSVDFRISEANGTAERDTALATGTLVALLSSRLTSNVAGSNFVADLLHFTPELDVGRVRGHLARITARGYAREQDLEARLTLVLRDVGHPSQ